jgi:hypothetical protein
VGDISESDPFWPLIAVIFLAHDGLVDLLQHGQDILVMKHEANRKGQDFFGELEEADGVLRDAIICYSGGPHLGAYPGTLFNAVRQLLARRANVHC